MNSVLTADLDYAVKIFEEMKPDASDMAKKGFKTKARKHLGTDYSTAKGVKLFGLEGMKLHPAIDLVDYEDELGVEISYAVIVDDGKGGLRFDSDEIKCYNVFTRDLKGIEERKKQIRNQKERENETA